MTSSYETVIRAKAILLADLFHQGRFTVPWHQRCYDWKANDVRELLYDIDEAIKEERDCYFLGAIMLVDTGLDKWEINDGQQRMVTMSLMCASLCRRFVRRMKESQREGQALRILFDIGINETCTLNRANNYIPRITPPINDAMRYRQIIRGNSIGTNGALTSAWKEIEKFFDPMNENKLNKYFDFLMQKLEVACLNIPVNIDPNAVYETLNNRGKKLDDFDLIRNYIYSHFNSIEDSERRNSVHDNLERIRIVIPPLQKASEYMRCHLQCRFGFLRKDHFYRDVRAFIRDRLDRIQPSSDEPLSNYIFDLTEQITDRQLLSLFTIIASPNRDSEFIRAFEIASRTTNSTRNLAVFLQELRAYKISQPLVFAILNHYIRESDHRKRKQIAKISHKNLKRLSAFILRTAFVAPKFEPSHFETEFSNYAKKIMIEDKLPDVEFANFLRECDRSEHHVLDDSNFYDSMRDKKMTGSTKIKIFLLGINSELQSNVQLLNQRLCNVEHILPKSSQHWGGWTKFKHSDNADWIHRMGNLTLLGPSDNKPGTGFNGTFTNKRNIFDNSEVALTRELARYSDWGPDTIMERQEKMAKLAVKVWEFD